MKLRLGVGFATRSSQARRPKHGLRIITSPIASCFAFRNLPRSARPFVSVQAGRKKPACRVRYICVVRTNRDQAPRDQCAPRAVVPSRRSQCGRSREKREHRGGRHRKPPARSDPGRTPASPPRVRTICAHCVRDVAPTPHPCPSPDYLPPRIGGSATDLCFGRHPMRPTSPRTADHAACCYVVVVTPPGTQ
ncbi:MAG: hypothetical protein JWM72_852 [Actinomycetia bacterium]|nr:hypothetical protein [Actinomycetes bacterium]